MKPVQKKSSHLLLSILIVLSAAFVNCETGSEAGDDITGDTNGDTAAIFDIQTQQTWSKLYSYNRYTGRNILHTGENSFITLTDGGRLTKVDKAGTVIWQKSFSGCRPDAIVLSADGYILATGMRITEMGDENGEFILMKIDMAGSVMWTKIYTGSSLFSPGIVACDKNEKSIILAGGDYTLYSGYKIFSNQQVIKLDSTGKIIWAKIIGTGNYDTIRDLKVTPDGGYIIISNNSTVLKLSSGGELKWTRRSAFDVWLNSIEVLKEGGFMLAGEKYSGGDNSDAVIIKLDGEGNSTWSRELHNVTGGGNWGEDSPDDTMMVWANRQYYDKPISIRATPDGGYAVFGRTNKVARTNITPLYVRVNYTGGWIIKLDAKCNISWQKKYADNFSYKFHSGDAPVAHIYYTTIDLKSFDMSANGGFVLTGGIKAASGDEMTTIIMKTDGDGRIGDTDLKIRNAQAVVRSIDISLETLTGTAVDSSAFSSKDDTAGSIDLDPGFVVSDF